MSKSRYIIIAICTLLITVGAQAQMERSFDYAVAQPDAAIMQKMAALEGGIKLLPAEAELRLKVALVDSVMGKNRETLSIAGKAFADQGKIEAADAIAQAMREHHAHYPYSTLLAAYVAQQRGMQYTSEADKRLRYSEFNDAAARLEELAELVADTLPLQREWLLAAGEMRYQGEDGVNARTDLERVMTMHPSKADSLDIHIMLAKFDRADAAIAMADSNFTVARECYGRAIKAYSAYLNQYPTIGGQESSLPKDAYTSSVVEDYLLSLYNLAYAERKSDNSLGGYRDLLTEARRYARVKTDDIRFQRYQLGAYFQLCTADSTLFPRYKEDYRQCMNYITDHKFPATSYTYDDYNYAQQWATYAEDRNLRTQYLEKCLETFDDKGGQAGLVEIKQSLYSNLIATYRKMGNAEREGELLRAYKDYRYNLDSQLDLSQDELLLVRNSVERLQKQREKRTMADAEIIALAEESKSILAKYLASENEDQHEAALRLTNNLSVAMIYLAPTTSVREAWYDSYAEILEQHIAQWRTKKEDWEFSSRHHENLYDLVNSYVLASTEDGLLRAQRKGFDVIFEQLPTMPSAEVKDEFLAARFHNLLLVILEHHAYKNMPEVSDSLDSEMLRRCQASPEITARLQNEQLNFYVTLRNVEYNDEMAHRNFYRQHFFTALAKYVDAGIPLALISELVQNLSSKYEEWMEAYSDLTPSEEAAIYWVLARGYYAKWLQAHRAYAADKVAASQRRKKAEAIALGQKGHFYACKCAATPAADDFTKNAIEIYEDYNYLRPSLSMGNGALRTE